MDAGMRARQPTILFVFTVIVGLARALSYAGTSAGLDSSPAAWARYVMLHVLAFSLAGAVVAWGVRDATLGPAVARSATAIAAGLLGPVALSLLVTPWPLPLLEDATTIPWGVHLAMAPYFGGLACVCLAIALAVANRPLHREFWARSESMWLPVLVLLPPP